MEKVTACIIGQYDDLNTFYTGLYSIEAFNVLSVFHALADHSSVTSNFKMFSKKFKDGYSVDKLHEYRYAAYDPIAVLVDDRGEICLKTIGGFRTETVDRSFKKLIELAESLTDDVNEPIVLEFKRLSIMPCEFIAFHKKRTNDMLDDYQLYRPIIRKTFTIADIENVISHFSEAQVDCKFIGRPADPFASCKLKLAKKEFEDVGRLLKDMIENISLPYFYDFEYAIDYVEKNVDNSKELVDRIRAIVKSDAYTETPQELQSIFLYVLN
jgi:hypothetical protein